MTESTPLAEEPSAAKKPKLTNPKVKGKPKISGPMDTFFARSKDQREKDIKIVLEKAPQTQVLGIKFVSSKASFFEKKMKEASERDDFVAAGECHVK